jgi:hypothetical protein
MYSEATLSKHGVDKSQVCARVDVNDDSWIHLHKYYFVQVSFGGGGG